MNIQPKALATRSSSRATNVNVKALLRAYNVNDRMKTLVIKGVSMAKKTISATKYEELPEQARRELDEFARIIYDIYQSEKRNREARDE